MAEQSEMQALPKVASGWEDGDGNAFAVMGRFKRAARDAGWTAEQISRVLDEATGGDYDNLLQTLMRYSD